MSDNGFIDMLYAHGIKFIIKGDILRNRIAFLYFETPFIVTLYNCHDSKLNLKNCIGDSINWFRS